MSDQASILNDNFICPKCGAELLLDEKERIEKIFTCPNCLKLIDLKNSPDGAQIVPSGTESDSKPDERTCPRCMAVIPSTSTECPFCGNTIGKHRDYSKVALTTAGIILIINGVFIFFENVLKIGEAGNTGNPFSGAIGNIGIAILILSGKPKNLKWARIGVCLGAFIYPLVFFGQGDLVMGILQILFSLSLLSLLFLNPGKTRILISGIFFVLFFGLEIISIVAELTGQNIIQKFIYESKYDLKDVSGSLIYSKNFNYSLQMPATSAWKRMSETDLARENMDADLWVMNTKYDAHIIVIAESLWTDLFTFTPLVMSLARNNISNAIILDSMSVKSEKDLDGTLFKVKGNIDDLDLIYVYGLFTEKGCCYQIICFSPADNFSLCETDFRQIIRSFKSQ